MFAADSHRYAPTIGTDTHLCKPTLRKCLNLLSLKVCLQRSRHRQVMRVCKPCILRPWSSGAVTPEPGPLGFLSLSLWYRRRLVSITEIVSREEPPGHVSVDGVTTGCHSAYELPRKQYAARIIQPHCYEHMKSSNLPRTDTSTHTL